MEYKILHYKPGGELDICGTLVIEGKSFDYTTESPELAGRLEEVKKQGYVPHFHDSVPDGAREVAPDNEEFISALEEYLGNYRIKKAEL